MQLSISTYIPGASPIHRLDARVKIVLLAVYSVMLFFVDTWVGMAVSAALFVVVLGVSRIAPSRVAGLVVPVYVLVGLAVVFNSFVFADPASPAGSQPGVFPLAGTFCFTVAGFTRGCFFAIRILLLVFASLVVTFTTSSTELTRAFARFLGPLRGLRVPVDDIATVLSVALRFIPVTAEEFCRVHDAQWSRGSKFGEGSLWDRLRAWQTVLIPLFVRLFRRADTLAQAMDARCYGISSERTSLHREQMGTLGVVALVAGLACCLLIATVL